MKVLLEQLMLKLEEDVDYQKNLESQIDELEKELLMKDNLIESLSTHHHSNKSHGGGSDDQLTEELILKLNNEKSKRVALEKIVLRLQNEKALLEVRIFIYNSCYMFMLTYYYCDDILFYALLTKNSFEFINLLDITTYYLRLFIL